jgi:hypothetical protein
MYEVVPVVIRQNGLGQFYGILPTLPVKVFDKNMFMVCVTLDGVSEVSLAFYRRLKKVPHSHRDQMIKYLTNLGYSNLRYYNQVRPWMHRDRMLAMGVASD